ncbi:MAG TPA: hypothetical protein VHL11_04830, partial [Phototrophicaceae bacterium]|nr:hypothetical protein [Phototrophicaceae bacterium]
GSHIELWFKYVDPTKGQYGDGIDRLRLEIAAGTSGYIQLKSPAFTLDGDVRDMELEISFRSRTGKMFVDDVSLIRIPGAGHVK